MNNDESIIKGVQLPEIRSELIVTLIYLMDGSYQEREWIEKTEPGMQESFDAEFGFCFEMIEDLNLFWDIKNDNIPYDSIGYVYKDKKEVDAVLKIAILTYNLFKMASKRSTGDDYPTNRGYLESKELYDLREESEKAFAVFMENEKENEEFCKFMYEVIIEQKRASKEELGGKEGYEGIKEYIKVCNRRNKEIRESRGI
jgi:hypothetical protein